MVQPVPGGTDEALTAQGKPRADLGGAFGAKGIGWAMFEFARNPYYNLIVIFVFAPYFADVIAGGGAEGQSWAGLAITIAGIICALTVPLMGAAGDMGARMKAPIAVFISILAAVSFSLWFVAPSLGTWGIPLGVLLAVMGYCSYTYSEVLHNSMLSQSARRSALPLVSGLAIGLGNLASVSVFALMLWGFILPAMMPGGVIPGAPLFGLDPSTFENVRIVGPLVAVWMVVFMIPFFLLMPERRPIRASWPQALGAVFFGAPDERGRLTRLRGRARSLIGYVRGLVKDCPDASRFLLARLIYADGTSALMTMAGVYVVGFFRWGDVERILMAILASAMAAFGAFIGGVVDRLVGPRRALVTELILLIALFFFSMSIDEDSILFGLVQGEDARTTEGLFSTLSDRAYLFTTIPIAMLLGAIITSSRVMMVQLAPEHRVGEFFGLYTIAGTITVWIGPGIVTVVTALSGDQRIGIASIALLFITGLALLLTIRKGARGRAQPGSVA